MGYLNSQPGDDQLVQAMGETGTDQVPGPDLFQGTGEAIAQAIPAAGESITHALVHMGGAIADALPQPVEHALEWTPFPHPELVKQITDERAKLDRWIESDKQYQGAGAQTIGGVAKGFTEFAVGAPAGALGAATVLGGTSASDTYDDLTAQGVDATTAKEGAAAAGAIGAAGAVVPFRLNGLAAKLLGTGAINTGLGLAGRASQAGVLDANGYHDLAQAQHAFDRQQMAVDFTLGTAMGFGAHALEGRVPPSAEDTARAQADQMHAADAGMGVPTAPDLSALHDEVFGRGIDDLNNGREPKLSDAEAQALAENVVPNPDAMRQQVESAALYAEDPAVQLGTEMGPKLDQAQAAVDANVPEFAPTGDIHPGEPSTFETPEQLAQREHHGRVAALAAKHGMTAEAAADLEGLAPATGRDKLTGFYDKDEHETLLRRAIDHAKDTGETVHYVETDLRNVGGRNKTMGHTRADDTIRADAQAFSEELGRVGHVLPIRRGGDEFAAVVVGARGDAEVQAALDRAEQRVQAAAEKNGTVKLANPKGGEGVGLVSAFRRLTGKERPRDVLEPIDREIERKKEERKNGIRTGETAGTAGAEPRAASPAPARAGEGAGTNGEGAQAGAKEPATKPLTPENEAALRQLEAKYGAEMIDLPDGERMTVAQLGQRLREEAAQADSNDRLIDAAVACFARTGGAL